MASGHARRMEKERGWLGTLTSRTMRLSNDLIQDVETYTCTDVAEA